MKKYITTLFLAAAASIHAQAADLEDRLQGYWQPDIEKTAALAKKAGRDENPEENPMAMALMGKMVFEFQNDKMTIHPPAGGKFDGGPPPLEYKVIAEDKAAKALTLSIDGEKTKIRFNEEQMAMSDEKEGGWMILNRMSKEDFEKRKPALAEILKEGGEDAPAAGKPEDVTGQPIPDKPATGRINGKDFKVEKAVLENSVLTLRQGKDFFADFEFMVFLFGQDGKFEGKTITVKPNQDSTTAHIHKGYKVEGKNLPETEIITEKYTMKIEFGTAKDGKIPGKIHLRLPDETGSFVVGTFEAEIK